MRPKLHIGTLQELPEELHGKLMHWGQRLADAVEKALGAEGAFIAINNKVSQSVPHLHVHVVPRTKGDGLRGFFWPRTSYPSADALAETGRKIRAALSV